MRNIILIGLIFLFAGCEKELKFEGACKYEGLTKLSTLTKVKSVMAMEGCHEVNKVEHSLISFDKDKNLTKEHWVIHGCDRTYDYLVRYVQEDCKRLYTGVTKFKR